MSQPDSGKQQKFQMDIRMLVAMIGILLAPFIGYLLSPNFGLGVLVVCLTVVAWMTWDLGRQVLPSQSRMLRMGAVLNGILAVAALVLLLIRL